MKFDVYKHRIQGYEALDPDPSQLQGTTSAE